MSESSSPPPGTAEVNHVPPVVQKFLKLIAMEWPEGSLQGLKDMADVLYQLDADLATLEDKLPQLIRGVREGLVGETGSAMGIAGNIALQQVAHLRETDRGLAKEVKNARADLIKTMALSVLFMGIAAVTIAELTATIVGTLAVPAVEAAAGSLLKRLLIALQKKLAETSWTQLTKSVAKEIVVNAAMGAGIMAGADLTIQVGQNITGDREGIDWNSVGHMALMGGLGGAGFGVGNAAGKGIAAGAREVDVAAREAAEKALQNSVNRVNEAQKNLKNLKTEGAKPEVQRKADGAAAEAAEAKEAAKKAAMKVREWEDPKATVFGRRWRLGGQGLYVGTQLGLGVLTSMLGNAASGNGWEVSTAGMLGMLAHFRGTPSLAKEPWTGSPRDPSTWSEKSESGSGAGGEKDSGSSGEKDTGSSGEQSAQDPGRRPWRRSVGTGSAGQSGVHGGAGQGGAHGGNGEFRPGQEGQSQQGNGHAAGQGRSSSLESFLGGDQRSPDGTSLESPSVRQDGSGSSQHPVGYQVGENGGSSQHPVGYQVGENGGSGQHAVGYQAGENGVSSQHPIGYQAGDDGGAAPSEHKNSVGEVFSPHTKDEQQHASDGSPEQELRNQEGPPPAENAGRKDAPAHPEGAPAYPEGAPVYPEGASPTPIAPGHDAAAPPAERTQQAPPARSTPAAAPDSRTVPPAPPAPGARPKLTVDTKAALEATLGPETPKEAFTPGFKLDPSKVSAESPTAPWRADDAFGDTGPAKDGPEDHSRPGTPDAPLSLESGPNSPKATSQPAGPGRSMGGGSDEVATSLGGKDTTRPPGPSAPVPRPETSSSTPSVSSSHTGLGPDGKPKPVLPSRPNVGTGDAAHPGRHQDQHDQPVPVVDPIAAQTLASHHLPDAPPENGGLGGHSLHEESTGTSWRTDDNGWHVAEQGGSFVARDRDGQSLRVEVPSGAKAQVDRNGAPHLIVLPDGISYERGRDGNWSYGREHRVWEETGNRRPDVILTKLDDEVSLTLRDGTVVRLGRENEVVLDQAKVEVEGQLGEPMIYRKVLGEDGKRLSEPEEYLRTPEGDWVKHADPRTFESWFASANKAYRLDSANDAVRTLHEIEGRSGPNVPEDRRLTNISFDELRETLLRRGEGAQIERDRLAAIYEFVRREKGISLRFTQLATFHQFSDRHWANMAAGEGKTWAFFASAVFEALRENVDGAYLVTTRRNLADREFELYQQLLHKLGFDVHRMDPDNPPPAPEHGKPTIYIGTPNDIGFTKLKQGHFPGQRPESDGPTRFVAIIDESDEALVLTNGRMVLSEGTAGPAPREVAEPIQKWVDRFLSELKTGELTEVHFGRDPEQPFMPTPGLTEAGRDRAEKLWGPLNKEELEQLERTAIGYYDYKLDDDFIIDDQRKLHHLDEFTHEPLTDPETGSETRINGISQVLEALHGLTIRDNPDTDHATGEKKVKSITNAEIFSNDIFVAVYGASGTALGMGKRFQELGHSGHVEDIPRYYHSRLEIEPDHVSIDTRSKLRAMAEEVRDAREAGNEKPWVFWAHKNSLVKELSKQLDELGVEHDAIDAQEIVRQGVNRREFLKNEIEGLREESGKDKGEAFNGRITRGEDFKNEIEGVKKGSGKVKTKVFNMMTTRGEDFPDDIVGRATAHSEVSAVVDIQTQNRLARSGGKGNFGYYTSLDEKLFRASRNEKAEFVTIQYTDAVAKHEEEATPENHEMLNRAAQDVRDLVPELQAEADRARGIERSTDAQPNAPPEERSGRETEDAGTSPQTPRPPPRRDSMREESDEIEPADSLSDERPPLPPRRGGGFEGVGSSEERPPLPPRPRVVDDAAGVDSDVASVAGDAVDPGMVWESDELRRRWEALSGREPGEPAPTPAAVKEPVLPNDPGVGSEGWSHERLSGFVAHAGGWLNGLDPSYRRQVLASAEQVWRAFNGAGDAESSRQKAAVAAYAYALEGVAFGPDGLVELAGRLQRWVSATVPQATGQWDDAAEDYVAGVDSDVASVASSEVGLGAQKMVRWAESVVEADAELARLPEAVVNFARGRATMMVGTLPSGDSSVDDDARQFLHEGLVSTLAELLAGGQSPVVAWANTAELREDAELLRGSVDGERHYTRSAGELLYRHPELSAPAPGQPETVAPSAPRVEKRPVEDAGRENATGDAFDAEAARALTDDEMLYRAQAEIGAGQDASRGLTEQAERLLGGRPVATPGYGLPDDRREREWAHRVESVRSALARGEDAVGLAADLRAEFERMQSVVAEAEGARSDWRERIESAEARLRSAGEGDVRTNAAVRAAEAMVGALSEGVPMGLDEHVRQFFHDGLVSLLAERLVEGDTPLGAWESEDVASLRARAERLRLSNNLGAFPALEGEGYAPLWPEVLERLERAEDAGWLRGIARYEHEHERELGLAPVGERTAEDAAALREILGDLPLNELLDGPLSGGEGFAPQIERLYGRVTGAVLGRLRVEGESPEQSRVAARGVAEQLLTGSFERLGLEDLVEELRQPPSYQEPPRYKSPAPDESPVPHGDRKPGTERPSVSDLKTQVVGLVDSAAQVSPRVLEQWRNRMVRDGRFLPPEGLLPEQLERRLPVHDVALTALAMQAYLERDVPGEGPDTRALRAALDLEALAGELVVPEGAVTRDAAYNALRVMFGTALAHARVGRPQGTVSAGQDQSPAVDGESLYDVSDRGDDDAASVAEPSAAEASGDVAPVAEPRSVLRSYEAAFEGLELGLDHVGLAARLAELSALAGDGRLADYTVEVLDDERVHNLLGALDVALKVLPEDQAGLRKRLRGLINDAVLVASQVPVREHTEHTRGRLDGSAVVERRVAQPLTPERLRALLTSIGESLGRGEDPFQDSRSMVAGTGYRAGEPMPVRLARLGLSGLAPAARKAVRSSELFRKLADNPAAMTNALFAGTGHEDQYFLNTGVAAAVNTMVRNRVPTLAGLLHTGRELARRVEGRIAAGDPAELARRDWPFGRTTEEKARQRVAEARREFGRIEQAALDLVSRNAGPAAWAELTARWGRVMQDLAAIEPDPGSGLRPVLTRTLVPGAHRASALLAAPVATVDRRRRRSQSAHAPTYFEDISASLSPATWHETSGQFGLKRAPLAQVSRDAGQRARFWDAIQHSGDVVVSAADRQLVVRTARDHAGKPLFVVSDPAKLGVTRLTPLAFDEFVQRETLTMGDTAFRRLLPGTPANLVGVPVDGDANRVRAREDFDTQEEANAHAAKYFGHLKGVNAKEFEAGVPGHRDNCLRANIAALKTEETGELHKAEPAPPRQAGQPRGEPRKILEDLHGPFHAVNKRAVIDQYLLFQPHGEGLAHVRAAMPNGATHVVRVTRNADGTAAYFDTQSGKIPWLAGATGLMIQPVKRRTTSPEEATAAPGHTSPQNSTATRRAVALRRTETTDRPEATDDYLAGRSPTPGPSGTGSEVARTNPATGHPYHRDQYSRWISPEFVENFKKWRPGDEGAQTLLEYIKILKMWGDLPGHAFNVPYKSLLSPGRFWERELLRAWSVSMWNDKDWLSKNFDRWVEENQIDFAPYSWRTTEARRKSLQLSCISGQADDENYLTPESVVNAQTDDDGVFAGRPSESQWQKLMKWASEVDESTPFLEGDERRAILHPRGRMDARTPIERDLLWELSMRLVRSGLGAEKIRTFTMGIVAPHSVEYYLKREKKNPSLRWGHRVTATLSGEWLRGQVERAVKLGLVNEWDEGVVPDDSSFAEMAWRLLEDSPELPEQVRFVGKQLDRRVMFRLKHGISLEGIPPEILMCMRPEKLASIPPEMIRALVGSAWKDILNGDAAWKILCSRLSAFGPESMARSLPSLATPVFESEVSAVLRQTAASGNMVGAIVLRHSRTRPQEFDEAWFVSTTDLNAPFPTGFDYSVLAVDSQGRQLDLWSGQTLDEMLDDLLAGDPMDTGAAGDYLAGVDAPDQEPSERSGDEGAQQSELTQADVASRLARQASVELEPADLDVQGGEFAWGDPMDDVVFGEPGVDALIESVQDWVDSGNRFRAEMDLVQLWALVDGGGLDEAELEKARSFLGSGPLRLLDREETHSHFAGGGRGSIHNTSNLFLDKLTEQNIVATYDRLKRENHGGYPTSDAVRRVVAADPSRSVVARSQVLAVLARHYREIPPIVSCVPEKVGAYILYFLRRLPEGGHGATTAEKADIIRGKLMENSASAVDGLPPSNTFIERRYLPTPRIIKDYVERFENSVFQGVDGEATGLLGYPWELENAVRSVEQELKSQRKGGGGSRIAALLTRATGKVPSVGTVDKIRLGYAQLAALGFLGEDGRPTDGARGAVVESISMENLYKIIEAVDALRSAKKSAGVRTIIEKFLASDSLVTEKVVLPYSSLIKLSAALGLSNVELGAVVAEYYRLPHGGRGTKSLAKALQRRSAWFVTRGSKAPSNDSLEGVTRIVGLSGWGGVGYRGVLDSLVGSGVVDVSGLFVVLGQALRGGDVELLRLVGALVELAVVEGRLGGGAGERALQLLGVKPFERVSGGRGGAVSVLRRAVGAGNYGDVVGVLVGLDRDPVVLAEVRREYRKITDRDLYEDVRGLYRDDDERVFVDFLFGVFDGVGGRVPVSLDHARWLSAQLSRLTYSSVLGGGVVPGEFPDGGGEVRAHVWAAELARLGVEPFKVFVIAGAGPLTPSSPHAADAEFGRPGRVELGRHAAVGFYHKNPNGRTELLLHDPAFTDPRVGVPLVGMNRWLANLGVAAGVETIQGSAAEVKAGLEAFWADSGNVGKPVVVITDGWVGSIPSRPLSPAGKGKGVAGDGTLWDGRDDRDVWDRHWEKGDWHSTDVLVREQMRQLDIQGMELRHRARRRVDAELERLVAEVTDPVELLAGLRKVANAEPVGAQGALARNRELAADISEMLPENHRADLKVLFPNTGRGVEWILEHTMRVSELYERGLYDRVAGLVGDKLAETGSWRRARFLAEQIAWGLKVIAPGAHLTLDTTRLTRTVEDIVNSAPENAVLSAERREAAKKVFDDVLLGDGLEENVREAVIWHIDRLRGDPVRQRAFAVLMGTILGQLRPEVAGETGKVPAGIDGATDAGDFNVAEHAESLPELLGLDGRVWEDIVSAARKMLPATASRDEVALAAGMAYDNWREWRRTPAGQGHSWPRNSGLLASEVTIVGIAGAVPGLPGGAPTTGEAEQLLSARPTGQSSDAASDSSEPADTDEPTSGHRVLPMSGMDDVPPWRDWRDPVGRVYEPFAGEDGGVHPEVLTHLGELKATMKMSEKRLQELVDGPGDVMSQWGERGSMAALQRSLEREVAYEVRRRMRGEPLSLPLVRTDVVRFGDVSWYEHALVGQHGLFLRKPVSDMLAEERPSLRNGRILGLYLGAVLDSDEAVRNWEERHPEFPHYTVAMGFSSRRKIKGGTSRRKRSRRKWSRVKGKLGAPIDMAAEGAADSMAFANTAVTSPLDGNEGAIDLDRVNAGFIGFDITIHGKNGKPQVQPVVAVVALDNAFDVRKNPRGMIIVDYGDDYLSLLEAEDEVEDGESGAEPGADVSVERKLRLSKVDWDRLRAAEGIEAEEWTRSMNAATTLVSEVLPVSGVSGRSREREAFDLVVDQVAVRLWQLSRTNLPGLHAREVVLDLVKQLAELVRAAGLAEQPDRDSGSEYAEAETMDVDSESEIADSDAMDVDDSDVDGGSAPRSVVLDPGRASVHGVEQSRSEAPAGGPVGQSSVSATRRQQVEPWETVGISYEEWKELLEWKGGGGFATLKDLLEARGVSTEKLGHLFKNPVVGVLVREWVLGIPVDIDLREVVELSGGLVDQPTVARVRSEAGLGRAGEFVGISGGVRREALEWRKGRGGFATLKDLLEAREVSTEKSKNGLFKNPVVGVLVREWILTIPAGVDLREVVELSGGLVTQSTASRVRSKAGIGVGRDVSEISDEIWEEALRWREGGGGFATLKDLLEARGVSTEKPGRRFKNSAVGDLVREWVLGIPVDVFVRDVAELSGGLVSASTVGAIRRSIGKIQSKVDPGVGGRFSEISDEVRGEVLRWREGGGGFATLKDLL
ncbi:hypothetical protein ACFWX1_02330, partial [Amycolatopsis sp. NPDC059021]